MSISTARRCRLWLGITAAVAVVCVATAVGVLAGTPQRDARSAASAPALSEPCVYVPILMYHDVANPPRQRYNVTSSLLFSQLQWLRDHGYTTVSLDQIAASLRQGQPLPFKSIAITFDDGPRNNISYAVPLLEYFGFRATFFVVADWTSRQPDRMTWDDVRELASRGHWIGSHSLTHTSNLTLKPRDLTREVSASRESIYQHTGISVTAYAYPYGRSSAAAERAAQSAGYAMAVGTRASPLQTYSRLYRLNRIEVRSQTPMSAFAALVDAPKAAGLCLPILAEPAAQR